VSVPVAARRAFLRSTPTLVSTWMLGGLMLSVGGSLLATVFDQGNHAVVGLVLGSFAGAAALASTLLRNRTPQFMTGLGTGLLVAGAGAVALSVVTVSWPVFVVGTVVAGAGFGPAFLGAFRSVSQLASDHERAGLISAIFIVSYLAFSIPAVLAGILIAVVGLAPTTLGYAGLVTVVAAATLVDQLVARRRG
jgi:MFS family permease